MRSQCICLSIVFVLVCMVVSVASAWDFWPGGKSTRDVIVDNDVVWTVGDYGVCRWDPADLSYTHMPGLFLDGVSECLSIDSDRNGGVWVGCSEARIAHYDAGSDKWEIFYNQIDESFIYPDRRPENISAVACDNSGNVWMSGARLWLASFDGVTWKGWKPGDSHIPDIYDIVIDNNDTKWFTANGGYKIYSFDGAAFHEFYADDQAVPECRYLSLAHDGSLWLCGTGNWSPGKDIWHVVDGHWTSIGNPMGSSASCCVADDDGSVWIGSNEGIAVYRDGLWEKFGADELADSVVINCIDVSDGSVWAGTNDGLTRCDWRGFASASLQGPVESEIVTIAESNDGSHWMGSPLVCFDGGSWRHYDLECTACAFDRSGGLWVGSNNFIRRLDADGNVTVQHRPSGSSNNYISGIVIDGNIVWVATSRAVLRYTSGIWMRFEYKTFDGLSGFQVRDIAVDSKGVLWVATENGVTRYDGVTWRKYTVADGLPSKDITAVTVDNRNRAWAGTPDGVACIDGDIVTSYDIHDGLLDNEVTCIETSPSGEVWIGSPHGITVFDGISWHVMLPGCDFWGSRVLSMCFDRGGDVWVGTNVGVNRLSRESVCKRDHLESVSVPPSLKVWPNPSNDGTSIHYTLDKPGNVRIEVYNLAGQRIKTLVSGNQAAGNHVVYWDGVGNRGYRAASGLYIARLSATGVSSSVKLTILR